MAINGTEFWRMDGVTYMFWDYSKQIRQEKPNTIVLMPFIIKPCYYEEHLIIRRLSWPLELFPFDASDGAVFDHPPNDLLFAIPPIVTRPDAKLEMNIELPDLNSEWICHYVFLRTKVAAVAGRSAGEFIKFADKKIEFNQDMWRAFISCLENLADG